MRCASFFLLLAVCGFANGAGFPKPTEGDYILKDFSSPPAKRCRS